MGIPWYVRERRPLLKVLLEFQGNGMEMKFLHMYNCFSCNVEECIHASAMERAIERMNGDVVEERGKPSSSTSRSKDTSRKEKKWPISRKSLGVPRTFNRKLVEEW